MSEETIRKNSLSKIRELIKDGKLERARIICSLFHNEKLSSEDAAFYGKLLLMTRQYGAAMKILSRSYLKRKDDSVARDLETARWLARSKRDYRDMRAGVALGFVMGQDGISRVLDVGSGGGEHALKFALAGKSVHCVDFGRSVYFQTSQVLGELHEMPSVEFSKGNFMEMTLERKYDLVWCSHTLEHQPDANAFLKRCLELVDKDGWLAITVPPLKHPIVGGHLGLWNAGLILYHLVIAGNDCSEAVVMNYGYNISIVVRKRPIILPELHYDSGDIDRIAHLLPEGCDEGFDGRMTGWFFDNARKSANAEATQTAAVAATAMP